MPLIKGKTAREKLMENGLWEEYRKQHPYNPMAKFYRTGTEPMTNDADVSALLNILTVSVISSTDVYPNYFSS